MWISCELARTYSLPAVTVLIKVVSHCCYTNRRKRKNVLWAGRVYPSACSISLTYWRIWAEFGLQKVDFTLQIKAQINLLLYFVKTYSKPKKKGFE